MLIGRDKEQKELLRAFNSDKAELIAIYGRRRVGKTHLIYEMFKNDIVFYHTGLPPFNIENSNDKNDGNRLHRQLEKFQMNLIKYGLADNIEAPTTWLRAFNNLEQGLIHNVDMNKRIVIFLDELPWMETNNSYFLEAFSDFWNNFCVPQRNIVLAVTGSASSWMLNKIIHSKGGLNNRVTCPIRLMPFSLKEVESFFEYKNIHYSRYEIAQAYMMVGGIPFYLDLFKPEYSLSQNIDELFFNQSCRLPTEFNDLFSSQFDHYEKCRRIIEVLSEKNLGLTAQEILDAMHLKTRNGDFYSLIEALEVGGFIAKYVPYTDNKRMARYKLIDPYCLFYLKHIKPNINKNKYWEMNSDTPKMTVWKGYAFENLCFYHYEQILRAISILGIRSSISLWYQKGEEGKKGSQIDLIIERGDNVINLCEMKFYSNEVTIDKDGHLNLMNKVASLREVVTKKYSIINLLVTTFGLKNNAYSNDFPLVVTLDDLFSN